MISFAAIMPHPPESIPGIGDKKAKERIEKTLQAFEQLRREFEQSDPHTVIVISPHARMAGYSFVINSSPKLMGNFLEFGLDLPQEYENDVELVDMLAFACETNEIPALLYEDFLDYGTLIPLYFLTKNIKPKIVQLSFSLMSYNYHYYYGEVLKNIIDGSGKRVAIIASGDLSHRLLPNSPAGYFPQAQSFDRQVVHFLGKNDVASLMEMDKTFISQAAECGLRSTIIMLGALSGTNYEFKLLSYEGAAGIGYLTARLK